MKFPRIAWFGLAATLVLGASYFQEQVYPALAASPVSVCSPSSFNACIIPNADGSINVNGGGGTGFAVTIADGADVAEGAKADAAWVSGSGSVIAILKNIAAAIAGSIPAGTAIVGKVGIDQTTPGTTNATQDIPGTSGGLSTYVLEPAASDNHANIKNGAGQVYWISVFNNSATINYIRLYNAASGFNGCNSATNLVYEGHIPASTSDAGFVTNIPTGIAFATGISICVTGAYGQTNTTNATASAISLTIGYK